MTLAKLRSLAVLITGFLFVAISVMIFVPICILLLPSRRLRIGACNVYGKIVVDLVTHDAKGVTELDLELARRMNAIADASSKGTG